MNVRYTPALIALLAGTITCAVCIVRSYDNLLSLKILLAVLLIFFIIGLMAKKIIVNTLKKSDEELAAEAKAREEEANRWNVAINTNEEGEGQRSDDINGEGNSEGSSEQ